MGRVAEAAADAALFDQGPDDRDEVIREVAEELSLIGHDQESVRIANLAARLRSLIEPPKCRWCGTQIPWGKHYTALGATFCSRQHMDEALLVPDPQEVECPPPPNE